jgi:hypothetical protein
MEKRQRNCHWCFLALRLLANSLYSYLENTIKTVYGCLSANFIVISWYVIIPRRKAAGDIEIVSVRPSNLPSVFPSEIFVRSISIRIFEASIWNFLGGKISLRRSAAHKNDNSTQHNFWVIAFCYFSNLTFVHSITQKAFKISTWNFTGG